MNQINGKDTTDRLRELLRRLKPFIREGSVLVRADQFTLVDVTNYVGIGDNDHAAFGQPCSTVLEMCLVRNHEDVEDMLIAIEGALNASTIAGTTNAILAIAGFAGWAVSCGCCETVEVRLANLLGKLTLLLCAAERAAMTDGVVVPELSSSDRHQFSRAICSFFGRAKRGDAVAALQLQRRMLTILCCWGHASKFEGGQSGFGNSSYFVDEIQHRLFSNMRPQDRIDLLMAHL